MLFMIYARDGDDENALKRRLAARERHVALCDESAARGEQIVGAALMNDVGQMCGSVMLMNFPDREALDRWLENEPYMTGDVWKSVEISECKLGPTFEHLLATGQ